MTSIKDLAAWGRPRNSNTVFGLKKIRRGKPNQDFWSAWRSSKQELKSAGVSVRKVKDEWIAEWLLPADEKTQAEQHSQLQASYAKDSDADIPCPDGLAYLPYQKAGIAYAMAREATLIGDQPGLGKTIQGIGVVNAMKSPKNVLVIVPATLRLNWKREAKKWLVHDLSIGVISSGKSSDWKTDNVVIINYENVVAHKPRIMKRKWDVVIIDEAHRLKNPKAKRTQAILGSKDSSIKPIKATKRILLTGTPICNRPIELHPIAAYLEPKQFGNFWRFARTYCDAHQTSFGWDFTGSSNLDQLHDLLRKTCMVRRLKEDVLKDLPAKQRQVVVIPSGKDMSVVTAELEANKRHQAIVKQLAKLEGMSRKSGDKYKEDIEQLRSDQRTAFADMSQARQDTALAKIPAIVDHLNDCEGPIIVFGHHKSVIKKLIAELGPENCVSITGDTPMDERQDAVDRFQNGEAKYFVGNIHAAGVGLTLTRSSHVVFAELDWVPGNVSQAEDRAHRIGQEDSVLCQHIVMDGSIDERMAKSIIAKQETIDEALDRGLDEFVAELPKEVDLKIQTRSGKQKSLITYSDEKKFALMRCLVSLSSSCDGAQEKDGVGFNGADQRFGRSLAAQGSLSDKQAMFAESILNKYRKQLGGLLEVAEAIQE